MHLLYPVKIFLLVKEVKLQTSKTFIDLTFGFGVFN